MEYLWLDFFYYYAVEFDIDKEVVSIRQSEPLYKFDKNWQSAYMAVEGRWRLCGWSGRGLTIVSSFRSVQSVTQSLWQSVLGEWAFVGFVVVVG